MIQWYPGHMAKARAEIQEKIKLVDVVFELLDARIPYSSQNPVFQDLMHQKKVITILTKQDLADSTMTKKWLSCLGKQKEVIAIDAISNYHINEMVRLAKKVMEPKRLKDQEKGLKPRPIRVMVLGIPNVGKSTLINRLVQKKVTQVGNKPGITKAQQWIRIHQDMELLDTPGVLWPKFDEERIGYHLALTGAIKDEILRKEDLVQYLLAFCQQYYPEAFLTYYQITNQEQNALIDAIGKKKGYDRLKSGDEDKIYDAIIQDFRTLKLGRITLDRLQDE